MPYLSYTKREYATRELSVRMSEEHFPPVPPPLRPRTEFIEAPFFRFLSLAAILWEGRHGSDDG